MTKSYLSHKNKYENTHKHTRQQRFYGLVVYPSITIEMLKE